MHMATGIGQDGVARELHTHGHSNLDCVATEERAIGISDGTGLCGMPVREAKLMATKI